MSPPRDDEDREAILARRTLLIASALGSLTLGATPQESTEPGPGAAPCEETATPGPAELAEARARTQHALSLRAAGDREQALAELERARALAPRPRLDHMIGKWAAELGRNAVARKALERYLRCAPADEDAALRADAEAELAAVRPRTALLTVRTGTQGAEVLGNGVPLGSAPLERLLVDAGRMEIMVRAPGFESHVRVVELAGGDEVVVDVQLPPPMPCLSPWPCLSPPPPPPPATGRLHFGLGIGPELLIGVRGSSSVIGGGATVLASYRASPALELRAGVFAVPTGSDQAFVMPAGGWFDTRVDIASFYALSLGVSGGYLVAPDSSAFVEPRLSPMVLRFGALDVDLRAGLVVGANETFVSTSIWFTYLFLPEPEEESLSRVEVSR